MAYGTAITQISYLVSYSIFIIVNGVCCKGRKGCPEIPIKDKVPFLFFFMITCASGINGCIALWMDTDSPAENNELLKNFQTFIAMTMVINVIVSYDS